MNNRQLTDFLEKVFTVHRLVFWHDENEVRRSEFAALKLDGVEKIEAQNDDHAVKLRIVELEPEQKFLIYHPNGASFKTSDNCLASLYRYHFEWEQLKKLQKLDLKLDKLQPIMPQVCEFLLGSMEAADRFQKLLAAEPSCAKDDPELVLLKMLVACAPTKKNVDFQELLLILLQKQYELSKSEKEAIAKGYLLDCRLMDLETEFFGFGAFREGFWALVKAHIGFVRKRDGDVLEQLALSLIKDFFREQFGKRIRMPRRAHAFIEVWRNHPKYRTSFRYWAEEIAPEMKGETLMISAKDTVAK